MAKFKTMENILVLANKREIKWDDSDRASCESAIRQMLLADMEEAKIVELIPNVDVTRSIVDWVREDCIRLNG